MKHQKHTDLARPALGQFGRREWAILGAPCSEIQTLAQNLIQGVSSQWKAAYVDADHHAEPLSGQSPLQAGAALVYSDKISHRQFSLAAEPDAFARRVWFNETDLVLINGNHFQADRQILIADPRKYESIQRKLDRLTAVDLVLLAPELTRVPDFLIEAAGQAPVFSLADTPAILQWLQARLQAEIAAPAGLVLAGGYSRRMGVDKGMLDYHGKPQREYLYELLAGQTSQTFISCRPDQVADMPQGFQTIPDTFLNLGPYGALLSAFRAFPDKAWLVAACDLPFIDAEAISWLLQQRDPSKMATAFQSPVEPFPDPLFTIWEPKSYPVLLQFLAQGYSCPRKVLINTDIRLLQAPKPEWLTNVNTPEEFKQVSPQKNN